MKGDYTLALIRDMVCSGEDYPQMKGDYTQCPCPYAYYNGEDYPQMKGDWAKPTPRLLLWPEAIGAV